MPTTMTNGNCTGTISAEEAWSAEQARYGAQTAGDFAALERMIGDDLVYIHSSSNVDTKASFIESQRSGTVKYRSMKRGAVKVRTADECVVFAGVAPSLAAPASAADFVADASIGTFRARSTFGTLVAARSVNRYQVGTVNRGIHELPHGLFATAVGSYARGGDPPVHTSRRTTPSVFDESDLYVAKILS